jgi:DNA-binding MarR family transcriptional regulator
MSTRTVTLIALARQTSRLMVEELAERLRAEGYDDMTAAHHPVFESIDRDGTRLTVLAARAGMTHQSMGELVAALERMGYVERRADPADARARLVVLTARGRAAVRRALVEIAAIEAGWQAAFDRAGYDVELHALLAAGIRHLESPAAHGKTPT